MKPVFNDIEYLYEQSTQDNNGLFICPVCSKRYKRKVMAEKHLAKRDCHDYVLLFKNTSTEEKMYEIYKNLMAVENKPVFGIKKFRKNRYYPSIARFAAFLYQNKIEYHFDYLQWVMENKPWNHIMGALKICCDERSLREYRKHKQKNISEQESKRFFNRYHSMFDIDPGFALRALERGEIGYGHLFSWIDVDSFINMLTDAEKKRLELFLEGV